MATTIANFICVFIIVLAAQATVILLSIRYRTYIPVIVPWDIHKTTTAGMTLAGIIIVININYMKYAGFKWNVIKKTVYHEYRHVWQMVYHTKTYLWWVRHPEIYKRMYRNSICSIERDAGMFGRYLGRVNQEHLILKYDSLWLETNLIDKKD